MSTQIVIAAVQSMQSRLLGIVSTGLAVDLAVSPIVIAGEVGIGILHNLKGVAKALEMQIVDIRCEALDGYDFQPILRNGEVVKEKPRIELLDTILSKDQASMIILDDAATRGQGKYAELIVAHIMENASSPVLLVFNCMIPELDETVDLAVRTTGIHRASMPTTILRMDRDAAVACQMMRGLDREIAEAVVPAKDLSVREPVLLLGALDHTGSKCGEQYFEMTVMEPYEHRVHFEVHARADQDDDALIEALQPMFGGGSVAVRVTPNEHGTLVCTTDDMEYVG